MAQEIEGLGERLRLARERSGISQRELARRLDLSPSMISQLEKDISKPSVGTLYAVVTELGVSVDSILRGSNDGFGSPPTPSEGDAHDGDGPLVHPDQRRGVDLSSGVRWEELIPGSEPGIEFLHTIYEVGGASTPDESLMRHNGKEYGYVFSGRLGIQIGFDTHYLEPGDSIGFDSTEPHRFFNAGNETVHAIWLVLDRDDPNGQAGGWAAAHQSMG